MKNAFRPELALEFKKAPYGRHSADLHYILNLMRAPSANPFHVLIVTKPGERWQLATMELGASSAPTMLDKEFSSTEEAEWYLFRVRWRDITGKECPID